MSRLIKTTEGREGRDSRLCTKKDSIAMKQDRRYTTRQKITALTLTIIFILAMTAWNTELNFVSTPQLFTHKVPCNRYEQEGYVVGNDYKTLDDRCPDHQFLQQVLAGESLSWLRGVKLLTLGDSILRDLCFNLGALMGHWQIDEIEGFIPNTTTPIPSKNRSRKMHLHETDFTVMSSFLYGFTDYDTTEAQNVISGEWPPAPYYWADRIREVASNMISDVGIPDVVLINGGAWDFKYMFRRDLSRGENHEYIPENDLKMYATELRKLFQHVRKEFPRAKIMWLGLHEFTDTNIAQEFWSQGFPKPEQYPALFTRRRVQQMQAAYTQAAADENIVPVPYPRIFAGIPPLEALRDGVHPQWNPAGPIGWKMILEELWRWKQYGV